MPQFTVLIPAFNREKLVAAALDTVAAQTFRDFEVLVVDDGSTDGTVAAAEAHPVRPRVLRQANAGPGAARNTGIAAATGRYVAFLDSDDVWFPWTLATYDRAIRENQYPAMVAGEMGSFKDEAELSAVTPGPYEAHRFADYLASGSTVTWFGTPGTAVRTDALRAVGGFSPRRINLEDIDLWLRLGTQPGMVFISSPVVFSRRLHDANVSLTVSYNTAGLTNLVDQELAGAYPGGGARRRERHALLLAWVRTGTVGAVRAGHVGIGLREYRRSFWWQIAAGRWRYVLGFPLMALGAAVRGRRTAQIKWR